jgi:hypothetical protein
VLALCDDFTEAHDLPALAKLDPAGRAEQAAARQALHSFPAVIWEAPKWRKRGPAGIGLARGMPVGRGEMAGHNSVLTGQFGC